MQAAGLMKEGDKPPKMTPQDIIEFIFFPVVNEGCRVIEEGIVDKPADLDVATVLAMGFPAYRWAPSHSSLKGTSTGEDDCRCQLGSYFRISRGSLRPQQTWSWPLSPPQCRWYASIMHASRL